MLEWSMVLVTLGAVFVGVNAQQRSVEKAHPPLLCDQCGDVAPMMISAPSRCDLTQYHWDCALPIKKDKPTRARHALIYCGNTPFYVSQAQYAQIARYQRADVNMVLTVNGHYIDSPCVPSGQNGSNLK